MLNYNIPAAVIYLHNHSTLDLLPSAVEKAWQKLAPLFMEDQSQTSAEVALISNKEATTCHLEAGSSKQVEHLLLLLHDKNRGSSKLMPFLTETEGHSNFCLKIYIGKS